VGGRINEGDMICCWLTLYGIIASWYVCILICIIYYCFRVVTKDEMANSVPMLELIKHLKVKTKDTQLIMDIQEKTFLFRREEINKAIN
jgi:hypothetical protein